MELLRLDTDQQEAKEKHAPSKFFFDVASTFLTGSKNDDKHGGGDEKSDVVDATNNTYTLGRGPLLQITDTKISRRHATISYDDEQKTWSILGLRTCFYCAETELDVEFSCSDLGNVKWKPLNKDDRIHLKTGYIISLLPEGKYAYKINIREAELDEIKENVENNQRSRESSDSNSLDKNSISNNQGNNTTSKKEIAWYENAFAVANCEQDETFKSTGPESTKSDDTAVPSTSTAANANPSTTNTGKRKSCSYGTSCYRRNPQHRLDEAHPGDNDYKEEILSGHSDKDEDTTDTTSIKPECEYGLDCYRKNPDHRKNYKHTSRPRAAKRKAKEKVAKVVKKQKDDANTYDSDFIDDETDLDEEDISSDEEDIDEWTPGEEDED